MPSSEADRQAEERLELMPRSVRDKLDRAGIKLHLREWQALTLADRERLRDLPCESELEVSPYASFVDAVVSRACGHRPDRLVKSK